MEGVKGLFSFEVKDKFEATVLRFVDRLKLDLLGDILEKFLID